MESDGALHGNARGGLRMLESYTRLVITYIHTHLKSSNLLSQILRLSIPIQLKRSITIRSWAFIEVFFIFLIGH
jgi:hypothetical protein